MYMVVALLVWAVWITKKNTEFRIQDSEFCRSIWNPAGLTYGEAAGFLFV